MLDKDKRAKLIAQEAVSLKCQLARIIALLDTNPMDLGAGGSNWGKSPQSELKLKMHEARRDMIRLEKIMYWLD